MPLARIFTSARAKYLALAAVALLVAVFLAGIVLVGQYAAWLRDPFAVREWVLGYGSLAPVVFIGLQAGQVVVAPIPGQVLGLVSGFLFGTLWGTVYSLVGVTIGSFVAFTLARRLGRPYVEKVITAETLSEFDHFTEQEGAIALFLVFLVPGLPDDVICFLAGLTEMYIPKMVAIALVGRFPAYLAVNAVGAGLASERVIEAVTILAILMAISALSYRYRKRLLTRIVAVQR